MLHSTVIDIDFYQIERIEPYQQAVHAEHAIAFIESGELLIEHGQQITAGKNDLLIIPAGVPHRIISGKNLKIWRLGFCTACLGFDENQRLMLSFRRVRTGSLPVVSIAEGRRDRVIALFKELTQEKNFPDMDSLVVVKSLLTLLLKEVDRTMAGLPQQLPIKVENLTHQVLNYIQLHGLEPISLKDVAIALHRSPAHVAATVKKSTGYSVGQWLTKGRLAEVCKLLAHSSLAIDEIAPKVGWQDTTYLIRQFKKEFGVTPAVWRKRLQNH